LSAFPTGKFALALHTSSPDLGLGISNFADIHRTQAWPLGRDLSVYLHTHLQSFIQPFTWQDFAWMAVSIGPGSYTGTRMGVVAARTLTQQLDLPLFAISTLAAAAWAACPKPATHQIAIELPAQQGQVYAAIYAYIPEKNRFTAQLPDQLYTHSAWQQLLSEQPPVKLHIGTTQPFPNADAICAAMLDLAQQAWQQGERPHWSAALPFYGEPPVRVG
jgi:tRNA threonylcarbamoyl adenosine modification protein YeaZ